MFSKRGSNATMVGMTKPLNYHIVIDRKDLPEVVVTNHSNAYSFKLKNEVKNPTNRYKALEYLALDEAIKDHCAALKQAKDENKLLEEANALFTAASYMNEGLREGGPLTGYWKNVARAARELHGK